MSANQIDALEFSWKAELALLLFPIWAPLLVVSVKLLGKRRVARVFCRLRKHDWADNHRYGTEPKCLHCGTTRGDE